MAAGDRDKALESALAQIDKQYGKGSVMRLGDEVRVPIETIPTGSIALDLALGIGGLPRGRVVEIYGPESSGKTTVALHAIANAQAAGGICAFIDAEHALDPDYAARLGVDTDSLLVSQPDNGEQALEIADMLVRSGALALIVIDSVAALTPRAEIEGEMGDSHVGLQARLMSQALRKMTGALSGAGTTAIFINQLREKIGVMFGSPETTTGGKALKFYSSIRLDVRRIETLKDGQDAVGNRTRVKVVKNKMAPPFKQAEFDILYGFGISREGSLIDLGVECGIVRKAGAWFTYDADQLGQGKENARNYLKTNPDIAERAREEDQGEDGHRPAGRRPGRGRPGDRRGGVLGRHRRWVRTSAVPDETRGSTEVDQVAAARDWLRRHGVEPVDDVAAPAAAVGGRRGADPGAETETGYARSRRAPSAERDRTVDLGSTVPRPGGRPGRRRRRRRAGTGAAPVGRRAPEPDADPEEVARGIVLRKLAVQARTRVELERALAGRDVPEEAAAAVLDRMTRGRSRGRRHLRARLGVLPAAAAPPQPDGAAAGAADQGRRPRRDRRRAGRRRGRRRARAPRSTWPGDGPPPWAGWRVRWPTGGWAGCSPDGGSRRRSRPGCSVEVAGRLRPGRLTPGGAGRQTGGACGTVGA